MDLLRGLCVLSISRRENGEDGVFLHRLVSLIIVKYSCSPPVLLGRAEEGSELLEQIFSVWLCSC